MYDKESPVYQNAKPTRLALGNRTSQMQLGQAALESGEFAKSLKWFTLASLTRSGDRLSVMNQAARNEAEQKVEEVKNKIAEIEMQHYTTSPTTSPR